MGRWFRLGGMLAGALALVAAAVGQRGARRSPDPVPPAPTLPPAVPAGPAGPQDPGRYALQQPHAPLVPGAHQVEAIKASVAELENGGRATVVMACGTGKTLVGAEVARALAVPLPAPLVVVLVPTIALVRQTLGVWLRQRPLGDAQIVCVCSDDTVGLPDETRVTTAELGQPVSTDPLALRVLFAGGAPTVVFSTYHSAPLLARGLPPGRAIDLAVFDEAHRTAGVGGKGFGFALADHNLPVLRRLFLTATPREFDRRRRMRDGDLVEVRSMDDQAVYGRQVYRLAALEAAERGIIANLKLVIGFVPPDEVLAGLLRAADDLGDDALELLAGLVAVRKFAHEYGLMKLFTFHGTVASAQAYTALAQRVASAPEVEAPLHALHVNGAMTSARREAIMAQFEQQACAQLSSVRCLAEGVDVPAVDAVALLVRKRSKLEIVQIAGRAMRKAGPQKLNGYLYVPVLLSTGQGTALDHALSSAQLNTVLDAVEAMQECDDGVREALAQSRRARGRGAPDDTQQLHPNIEIVGPPELLPVLRRALVARVVSSLTGAWDEMFGALEAFAAAHGHARVPDAYRTEGGAELGNWLGMQTYLFRAGRLSPDRTRLLDSLGVSWFPLAERFDHFYARLEVFCNHHGHCRVPERIDQELARWIREVRKQAAMGLLDPDHASRLDRLGFKWRHYASFEDRVASLRRYRDRYEGSDTLRRLDRSLYQWLKLMDKNRSALSGEQIALLEAAGWAWALGDHEWSLRMDELRRIHSGPAGPDGQFVYGDALLRWIARQRMLYQRGVLTPAQVAELKAVGLEVDPWRLRFLELQRFMATNGHCRVPSNTTLARWLVRQRRLKREGRLNAECQAQLEAIGVEW